jgi:hypothetical protein
MPAMPEEFESHCPFICQGGYEALDNLIAVDRDVVVSSKVDAYNLRFFRQVALLATRLILIEG